MNRTKYHNLTTATKAAFAVSVALVSLVLVSVPAAQAQMSTDGVTPSGATLLPMGLTSLEGGTGTLILALSALGILGAMAVARKRDK